MAANTSAIYVATVQAFCAAVTAANTARDGSGATVTLVDGGDNGARVDRIEIKAQVAVPAGVIRLFIEQSGTAYLLQEIPVALISPSPIQPTFAKEIGRTDGEPLVLLGPGELLKVSTHTAHHFDVTAFGGLY